MPAESQAGRLQTVAGPFPQNVQRLVLTGFMGSGKSTVGRLLAQRLDWEFFDLDASIEARFGLSVPQFFALHGEPAFRAAEVQDLKQLLGRSDRVIALGGGAPGTPALRDLLARSPGTAVVHLLAPFPVLYERCQRQAMEKNPVERPLLGDREAAERRYRERLGVYAAVAHCAAEADLGSPEAVTENVLQLLKL